jgi:hypothetical protein
MLQAKDGDHSFDGPGAAQQVTKTCLGSDHRNGACTRGEELLQGPELGPVVEGRPGAMGVDEVHILSSDTGVAQALPHGQQRTFTRRVGRGHVVGVCSRAGAEQLRQGAPAPRLDTLPALQNEHGAALAQGQAGTVGQEGPARLGIDRLEGVEPTERCPGQTVTTAGDCHIDLAGAERFQGETQGESS